jgi:ABC-2 type transport system ATP-binding protein
LQEEAAISLTQPIDAPRPVPSDGQAPPASAHGTVLLQLENVSVAFGNFFAVRNVSLELRAGHLLGLIGPNGAGKTTLLRAIASLQSLSSGTIRVLGEKIKPGQEDAARMIGFTPDVPPLYDGLTVAQFLEFIAAGYGLTPENLQPAIDFWLEKVWLSDKKHQKVKSLSRGMKQRLGIARTLLPNPQIILLDEPASGLDPAGRVQFRRLLTDLRDQGKTLIVSSHILSDMEEYCTHIAMVSHGTLMKYGTVREIAEGADTGQCRYTIELVEPLAGIDSMLSNIPDLELVETARLRIIVKYWSDRLRAQDLLRQFIELEIPVCGFTQNAAGLEEAYLQAGIRQVD